MTGKPILKPHSLAESLYFFRRWLRDPYLIGAVAPSGRDLAAGMAGPVDPAAPGAVIELGGGTGRMTRGLLDRGIPPADLFPVEKDETLYGLLVARFPELRIIHGDAADLAHIAGDLGLAQVKAVVSGLPLIGMPRPVRRAIVGSAFDVLAPGGIFVQFTYTPVSPVHASIMEEVGIAGRAVKLVWLNLPPARVWVYRRLSEA